MTVRTTVFAHGRFTGTGVHAVYTVPAGKVGLVKGFATRNSSGAAKDVAFGAASSSALTDPVDFVGSPGLANLGSVSFVGFWALAAGNVLYISLNNGGTFDYWISGAELS